MKKIVLLGFILCFFSGCAIFRTTDVTISNNSDHNAYVTVTEFRRNGDLHGSTGGSDYVELLPYTSTTYKLYDKGEVKLTKPNRNFLKKQSNESYEVLNSPKKVVKVFNKIGEKVILSEANNLFDKITMESNEIKNIDVFTLDHFTPFAVNAQGVILKTSFQHIGLVISF
jgi:hypothetical protein